MERHLLLTGVLLPACAAVLAALLMRGHRARWMGIALTLALAVSVSDQQGHWKWPRAGEWSWLVIATAATGVCGAAAGRSGGGSTVTRGVACGVASCVSSLLLPLPGWHDATLRLSLATAGAASAAMLLPIGTRRGGFSAWASWSLSLAAPSLVALSCGFAKLAVAIAAISAACGVMAVVTVVARRPIAAGVSGSLVIALCCVQGSAVARAFDSLDTPAWVFVVAASAPLGAWLGEAPTFRGAGLVSALARLIGVAAIAGLAVWAVTPRLASDGASDAYALVGGLDPHPIPR